MEIKKLSSEEFFTVFKALRSKYFNETLWFSSLTVRTDKELEAFERLYSGMKNKWELHLGLYDEDKLIGWSSSYQTKTYELYMMNSLVFPEYRRKGLYSQLLQKTIDEAKREGFQTITSHHVCTNNDVIIAKLKHDFKITGLEVTDEFGVIVKLTKFLNTTRADAIEFRSGQAKPSEELKTLFTL